MAAKMITLNFNNFSNDQENLSIGMFYKNQAWADKETAIVWKVITGCAKGQTQQFEIPPHFQVSASDATARHLRRLTAKEGDAFEVVKSLRGTDIKLSKDQSAVPSTIEVRNGLPLGEVTASIYKDGRLLDVSAPMHPSYKAVFQFDAYVYFFAAKNLVEGQTINLATLDKSLTEIDLFGVASADIVMTGGGIGPMSTPLDFHLANILQHD